MRKRGKMCGCCVTSDSHGPLLKPLHTDGRRNMFCKSIVVVASELAEGLGTSREIMRRPRNYRRLWTNAGPKPHRKKIVQIRRRANIKRARHSSSRSSGGCRADDEVPAIVFGVRHCQGGGLYPTNTEPCGCNTLYGMYYKNIVVSSQYISDGSCRGEQSKFTMHPPTARQPSKYVCIIGWGCDGHWNAEVCDPNGLEDCLLTNTFHDGPTVLSDLHGNVGPGTTVAVISLDHHSSSANQPPVRLFGDNIHPGRRAVTYTGCRFTFEGPIVAYLNACTK